MCAHGARSPYPQGWARGWEARHGLGGLRWEGAQEQTLLQQAGKPQTR